ncbi:MAG: hypothetical protein AB1641_11415 [Thermodesulfobacteriota bacterium]
MAKRNFKYAVGLALALLLALGVLLSPPRVDHFWEKFPFFEAAFGFLGCLLIIFASKALGHLFLQKKEDYYGD